MMQVVTLNFSNVFTPELYASGEEVPVKITKASWHESKAGNLSISLQLEHRVDIMKAPIREYLPYPNDEDDDLQRNNKMLRIKKMLVAFGIAVDGDIVLDLSDSPMNTLVGHEGFVVVGVREDQEGLPQNNVMRYGIGR